MGLCLKDLGVNKKLLIYEVIKFEKESNRLFMGYNQKYKIIIMSLFYVNK